MDGRNCYSQYSACNASIAARCNKTKVMTSGERQKPVQKAARWPCGVCGRGVSSSSIQCTSCHKWLHKKCSGTKGSMYKVMKSFICRGCSNPVISKGHTSVDIGASANLEVVDKFCYLGDTTAKQVVMVWACVAKRRHKLGEEMYGI